MWESISNVSSDTDTHKHTGTYNRLSITMGFVGTEINVKVIRVQVRVRFLRDLTEFEGSRTYTLNEENRPNGTIKNEVRRLTKS